MDAVIEFPDGPAMDDVLALRRELVRESELRGRVTIRDGANEPGSMGAVLDAILVSGVPAAAAGSFTAVTVAWLRQRKSNLKLKIRTAAGEEVELEASQLKSASAEDVAKTVQEVSARFK